MNHGDRREDCPEEVAKVGGVLDGRLGVPVPLEDDALGLIFIEVDAVLQRAGVLSPHDLHGLIGQALELLELALVKLEPSDTPKLTHCSGLSDSCVAGWVDTLGYQGERPPNRSTRARPSVRGLHGDVYVELCRPKSDRGSSVRIGVQQVDDGASLTAATDPGRSQ